TGIPAGTTITAILSPNSISISQAATATNATASLSFGAENVVTGQVTVAQGELDLNKSIALPFRGNLVIGDNRDTAAASATVKLLAANQLPVQNFYNTGLNSVTVNSTGKLDFNNNSATIGNLNMVTGRSVSAAVTTGTGTTNTVTFQGDITVTGGAE